MSQKTHDDPYTESESPPPKKRLITRRRVLIGGGAVGVETAMWLADRGKEVSVLEMEEKYGRDIGRSTRWTLLQDMRALGVDVRTGACVSSLNGECLEIDLGEQSESVQADTFVVAVGSEPRGNGRWGHADLGGSVDEWVFDWHAQDWYTTTETGCSDCANLTAASYRVFRGGYWYGSAFSLRAANRFSYYPAGRNDHFGFRCSRTP